MQLIQAIRGMNDILPDQVGWWQRVEETARETFAGFGYREIRTPVIEKLDLFARSIGESTDIVEKEMYAFPDRKGEMLALRPEATASIVRAFIQHNLFELGRPLQQEPVPADWAVPFFCAGGVGLGNQHSVMFLRLHFFCYLFYRGAWFKRTPRRAN